MIINKLIRYGRGGFEKKSNSEYGKGAVQTCNGKFE